MTTEKEVCNKHQNKTGANDCILNTSSISRRLTASIDSWDSRYSSTCMHTLPSMSVVIHVDMFLAQRPTPPTLTWAMLSLKNRQKDSSRGATSLLASSPAGEHQQQHALSIHVPTITHHPPAVSKIETQSTFHLSLWNAAPTRIMTTFHSKVQPHEHSLLRLSLS
jgi:hypothetical protein